MMGKRLVMLVATMALVVASCGGGTIETAGSAEPVGDGIGVHGAWTIEVFGTEGERLSKTQFPNDLLAEGAVTLAQSFVGSTTLGDWALEFGGSTRDDNPCEWVVAGSELCPVTPQVVRSGDLVILSGDRRATKDGMVTQVVTLVGTCDSTVAPQDCNGPFKSMTGTTFDPIPVVEGQTVQIEVELSFGTLTTP